MDASPAPRTRAQRVATYVLAGAMIAIGVTHFTNPDPFVKIVPAFLPAPRALVLVSGFFEIAGGAGLLVDRTRRLAAWGLVALYVAVFPANVNQAVNAIAFDPAHPIPQLALWARLPFQALFIAWAWWVGIRASRSTRSSPSGSAASAP